MYLMKDHLSQMSVIQYKHQHISSIRIYVCWKITSRTLDLS